MTTVETYEESLLSLSRSLGITTEQAGTLSAALGIIGVSTETYMQATAANAITGELHAARKISLCLSSRRRARGMIEHSSRLITVKGFCRGTTPSRSGDLVPHSREEDGKNRPYTLGLLWRCFRGL